METLKHNFLEDPTYVLAALGVALLVVVVLWYRTRRKQYAWALAGLVVAGAGIWALATSVQTDREKIYAAAEQIARDFETGNMDGIPSHLDEKFLMILRGERITKPMVVQIAASEKAAHNITSIRFMDSSLEISGPYARLSLATIIRWQYQGNEGISKLLWKIRWVKKDGVWRVLDVQEPVQQPLL